MHQNGLGGLGLRFCFSRLLLCAPSRTGQVMCELCSGGRNGPKPWCHPLLAETPKPPTHRVGDKWEAGADFRNMNHLHQKNTALLTYPQKLTLLFLCFYKEELSSKMTDSFILLDMYWHSVGTYTAWVYYTPEVRESWMLLRVEALCRFQVLKHYATVCLGTETASKQVCTEAGRAG